MPIACQTITFGDQQNSFLAAMLGEIRQAGYSGVEMGYRRIADIEPRALVEMLAQHDLELVASHIGGNLQDPEQAAGERSLLDAVLDYLDRAGTTLLMYSGLHYEDSRQFGRDLEALNHAAEACARRGIRLCYHNHYWEMENEASIMSKLLSDASPELGFCPDIGWIVKGGAEPFGLLELLKDRIGLVHFKDFASTTPGLVDTVEFGEGIVPLARAADWVRDNLPQIWSVAEQDRSDLAPADAVRRNAAFLKKCFGTE